MMLLPPERSAGRFAPTPTGSLHLGNVYTALLAHVSAHALGLHSILRIDDLDLRSFDEAYIQEQSDDLNWLGIQYDEGPDQVGVASPYLQSLRQEIYQQSLVILNEQGLLYPCFCSRKDIAAAYAPHADQEGMIYPGTCRPKEASSIDLSDIPERNGRVATLRLNVHEAVKRRQSSVLSFVDLVAGDQVFDLLTQIGDFILRRRDHIFAYQLACAVDDYTQGCSLVLRGRDLLPSTARQLIVLESLAYDITRIPKYAHIGLFTSDDGRRLAKRHHSLQLKTLRESGVPASAVRRALSLAWGGPDSDRIEYMIHAFAWHHIPSQDVVCPHFDI